MPKNQNIQTVCKNISTAGSHIAIGSSVAATMTRYVTMVKVSQTTNGASKGSRVLFCESTSSASASTVTRASALQKLNVGIVSASATKTMPSKTVTLPEQPNTDNPLFTIAASKFLTAFLATAAGQSNLVNVFVQYYDQ